MTIGVIIKGTNTIHHKHWPHFFAEVVTGLIILEGLFGWMDYLIYAKWFIPVDVQSYERVPMLKGVVSDKCVMDWPMGKFGDEESWS